VYAAVQRQCTKDNLKPNAAKVRHIYIIRNFLNEGSNKYDYQIPFNVRASEF